MATYFQNQITPFYYIHKSPPEVTKENWNINRILFLPQIEVVTLSYLTL